MYNGKTSKLALQKTVLCTGCSGEGGKKGKNTSSLPCYFIE